MRRRGWSFNVDKSSGRGQAKRTSREDHTGLSRGRKVATIGIEVVRRGNARQQEAEMSVQR